MNNASATQGEAPITEASTVPQSSTWVLVSLVLVAAVANLNLAVANVALPDIGKAFTASQTQLNLVAIGYSLGLAASVIYLGALGDRYGRKLMLLLGTGLSIPACMAAAAAPSIEVLVFARLLGGLSAGMAFPTTLALITALWSGPARTKAIALWSGVGGAVSALGPLLAGFLLQYYFWGSVFLVALPLAAVALVLAIKFVPAHVNEGVDPVDNLGGMLSILMVGALVLAINFAAVPNAAALAIGLAVLAVASGITFVIRQRRAEVPLFDLHIAGRQTFWVAAVAGIVVFGSLMGAMFIGQQFLQNVLGYSTLASGAAILPAAVAMVIVAPLSAKLITRHGSRFTLLLGYGFCLLSFLTMLLLWNENSAYWHIGLAYALVGAGVALAGTPASSTLTGSVPLDRAGMASGTADLQRDLGGAIMQSILGAVLTLGYASAFAADITAAETSSQQQVSEQVQAELQKSFSSAEAVAEQYPQYASQITTAAKTSFSQGQNWAFLAGSIAIALGFILVYFKFPKHNQESELLEQYRREDTASLC